MLRGRRTTAIAITTAVVAMLGTSALFAPAQAQSRYTKGVTASVSGTTATVRSSFGNPDQSNTKMLIDTEVYDSRNQRVAQWSRNVSIARGTSVTDVLTWDLSTVAAGSYTFKQGLFRANWAGQIDWNDNAGSLNVGTATTTTVPSTWVLSATAAATGSTIATTAKFTAPTSGTFLLDTEIWDSANQKAAQWTETKTVTAGQALSFPYSWSASASGTYSVRQGVFSTDWSQTLAWSNASASATVGTTTTTAPVAPTTTTTVAPTTTTTAAPAAGGNPLAGATFYGPNPGAQGTADAWRASRPADAALMQRMADTPTASWIGGWSGNPATAAHNVVTAANGRTAVIVTYNIPGRDCGGYSSGGAGSEPAYDTWIDGIAAGIGDAKAVVVIEPDALAQMCGDTAARYRMLNHAVDALRVHANTTTYLDAGNATWIAADEMASRLQQAGVSRIRGFAINVSNFLTTSQNLAYGDAVTAKLGGSHYIVDTSRNGNGSNGEWCNPSGRALGQSPTTATGSASADAYLWLKVVGESDGDCGRGEPAAGTFWADYALGLAQLAWS